MKFKDAGADEWIEILNFKTGALNARSLRDIWLQMGI